MPLPREQWDQRAAALLALPGIGPWTVAYLRMRLFGDPDAVPVGDLVLRRALGVAKDREVPAAMEALAAGSLLRRVPALGVDRLVSSSHSERRRGSAATSSSVSWTGFPRMLLARCAAATTSAVSASLSP